VRKRKTVPRMRSIVFTFMPRGPSLKILPLGHKAVVVDKRAILCSRRGPHPLGQEQIELVPVMLGTAMMCTSTYLPMCKWLFPFILERTRRDPPLVNYMKGGTDMRPHHFQDPRELQRSFFIDDQFWLAHQADWYESIILPKGCISIETKWVDWPFLLDLPPPILEAMQVVHTCCWFMGISYLIGLHSDYSKDVVAQFYATLYVDNYENMHFTLGGKRFSITLSEFATLFKLRGATTTNQFSSDLVRLHSGDELEVTKMRFMYDRA
jgi:hypothetical protein